MLVLEAFRHAGAPAPVADLAVNPREPVDLVPPELLNAIEVLEDPVVLVLDDLHRISSPEVYEDLELLLRHPSPKLRLVISTRFDPPIGVERLRLAGQVTELRASDLAFTLEEASELFELLDLRLAETDLEVLWRRAEGWAAALRLAASTLRGRSEPERLVAELAGDESNIADYLLAEVLASEPPDVRDFLLCVAIVDELPVELAVALSERPDAGEVLAGLAHRHALISPIGEGRDTYHLHTLFGELLRAQLKYEQPGRVTELHTTAALWFDRQRAPVTALRHALQAGAYGLASRLARDCWISALATGELPGLRSVIEALPQERVEGDPELAIALAASLVDTGRSDVVARYLTIADELADTVPADRRQRFEVGRATLLLYRGRSQGDLAMAQDAAEYLLSMESHLEASDDEAVRALAFAGLGVVELWTGSVEEGMRHLERGLAVARAAELEWLVLLCSGYLALGSALAGRLAACEQRAQATLDLAAQRGWIRTRPAGVALTVLAGTQFEWDRIDEAERTLARAEAALRLAREPPLLASYELIRGRILAARGRLGEALEAFEVALDKLAGWGAAGNLRALIETETAVIRAGLGDRDAAQRDLEMAEAASILPAPAIARARLALADGDPAHARELLTRPLEESSHLFASHRVHAWVLDAIACDELADHSTAHQSLEQALDAAEPGGFKRPLLAHGRSLLPVLRRQLRIGTAHRSLVEDLLVSLGEGTNHNGGKAILAERLSDREAAVLRYLPTMMSNQEIASELFVSVNTVKTHLRAIYRKLDASDRREAVTRARELELLAP
jgi:LuxR family maltose regulon positive regulatory protein